MINTIVSIILLTVGSSHGFFQPPPTSTLSIKQRGLLYYTTDKNAITDEVSATEPKITLHPEAIRAKAELLNLSKVTKRGFSASSSQRKRAKELANILAKYNPVPEPASPFYAEPPPTDYLGPTLSGKWTLVYTDAPDITTLEGGPLATAKLGRIGQECSPPFIKNVIEWKRPDWAKSFPNSGTDESRVIQKVCCEAKASREKPTTVELKLAGLDLFGMGGLDEKAETDEEKDEGKETKKQLTGGPGEFFEKNPLELRGPLKTPFGRFEVLYLDEDMRVTRTGQGFLAVNTRNEEDWF